MKRRIDYADMNWFEKRRVLRMEKKVQDRKRKKEMRTASPKKRIAWGRILILAIIVILLILYWDKIMSFINRLF